MQTRILIQIQIRHSILLRSPTHQQKYFGVNTIYKYTAHTHTHTHTYTQRSLRLAVHNSCTHPARTECIYTRIICTRPESPITMLDNFATRPHTDTHSHSAMRVRTTLSSLTYPTSCMPSTTRVVLGWSASSRKDRLGALSLNWQEDSSGLGE